MLKKITMISAAILAGLAIAAPAAPAQTANNAICDVLTQTDAGMKTVQELIADRAPESTGPPVALVFRRVRDGLAPLRAGCPR